MYYILILISVLMFGGCFALNDVYQSMRGNSLKIIMQFSLNTALAGLVILLIINGFRFEFTAFSFVMALLVAVNSFAYTFCSFKALNRINLSLYSLFAMLGGMVLPFVQGIVFYGEKITASKLACFVLIFIALLLTIKKGEKTKEAIYYIGVFILNGMSGVLSKIFASARLEKTSAAGFSVLCALVSVIIAFLVLILFFRKKDEDETPATVGSIAVSSAQGIVNRIANFILIIALAHVDASVQYPMVTGGVIIVSTAISFLRKNKPSKRELASVAVAFTGLLLLFAIPD